ncbi:hypothetical protein [Pseudoduganella lurida]|nr:hypothetical protein [Pseudoduganella lurida]
MRFFGIGVAVAALLALSGKREAAFWAAAIGLAAMLLDVAID